MFTCDQVPFLSLEDPEHDDPDRVVLFITFFAGSSVRSSEPSFPSLRVDQSSNIVQDSFQQPSFHNT